MIESRPRVEYDECHYRFKLKNIKQNDMVKLNLTFKHFCYDNWKKMVEGDKKVPVKKVEEEIKPKKLNPHSYQPGNHRGSYQPQPNNQYFNQNPYNMSNQAGMGYQDNRYDYSHNNNSNNNGMDYNNMMMMYMQQNQNMLNANPMMMYSFNMMNNMPYTPPPTGTTSMSTINIGGSNDPQHLKGPSDKR